MLYIIEASDKTISAVVEAAEVEEAVVAMANLEITVVDMEIIVVDMEITLADMEIKADSILVAHIVEVVEDMAEANTGVEKIIEGMCLV